MNESFSSDNKNLSIVNKSIEMNQKTDDIKSITNDINSIANEINRSIGDISSFDYLTQKSFKIIPVKDLFEHYFPEEVEGYCKNCPNYNRIWSCPPHDFSALDYLKSYDYALVIGNRIRSNHPEIEELDCFQKARREIGNQLIQLNKDYEVEVLIAGNCYQCENCNRESGSACVHKENMKYSLESIGFKVGDITDKILNEPLSWGKNGQASESLMTVGVIFSKTQNRLEEILKEL